MTPEQVVAINNYSIGNVPVTLEASEYTAEYMTNIIRACTKQPITVCSVKQFFANLFGRPSTGYDNIVSLSELNIYGYYFDHNGKKRGITGRTRSHDAIYTLDAALGDNEARRFLGECIFIIASTILAYATDVALGNGRYLMIAQDVQAAMYNDDDLETLYKFMRGT